MAYRWVGQLRQSKLWLLLEKCSKSAGHCVSLNLIRKQVRRDGLEPILLFLDEILAVSC